MKTITVENHIPRKVGPSVEARIKALKIGQRMQDLPEHLWHESFRYYVKEDPNRRGGPNLRLIRLDPQKPALTVTGFIFNKFVHPFQNRYITPREAARLQGFPDKFVFSGSLGSTQIQIGNAVPIELGQAVFKSVLREMKRTFPKRKHFTALSLFSGAGGLDLAADNTTISQEAYIKTIACIEYDSDSCATLRNNFKDSRSIIESDIRTVDPKKLVSDLVLQKEDLSLVYGGPPCQSFSQAGKQLGTDDPRGQLVSEFLRFVKKISPSYFLIENVSNLRGIDGGKLMAKIENSIKKIGYSSNTELLNSAEFGSAQVRRRLFILGSRKGLSPLKFPTPTHSQTEDLFGLKPYKTVGQAFEGLPFAKFQN